MREHRQVLSEKQKVKKAVYMRKYAEENTEELKAYQKERQERDKEQISARKKKFAQDNPEIIQARSKKYYEENKEAIDRAVKEYRLNNLEKVRSNARKYSKNPKGRLQSYKHSAKIRGYDFSLPTDQFNVLLFEDCHYCGQEEAMGIDRKDNNIGYFSYNVVPCFKISNFMKRDMNYQNFITHIKKINELFS